MSVGKVLLQWEESDDPVGDHLKHSPDCQYALRFKVRKSRVRKYVRQEQKMNRKS